MTANEKRQAVVTLYLTRKGCNAYTQGPDRVFFFGKPEGAAKGFSDCSSSWREAFKRLTGIDIGGNTAAQIVSTKMVDVCLHTKGQPDMSKLQRGDLLYFKGSDPSRPYGVGHVEGYIGDGKIAGHGSGTGPRVTNLKDYCAGRYASGRGLIKVRRVIMADDAGSVTPPAEEKYPLGFGERMLRFGCAGTDVANLQRALIRLGYSCGKYGADGEFGSATKNAVVAYQHKRGLEADGVVGAKTVAAMEADLPEEGDSDGTSALGEMVLIHGGNAFVRDQPHVSGRKLGVAMSGKQLPWRGETSHDGWQAVDLDGEDGWVSGKYAKVQ